MLCGGDVRSCPPSEKPDKREYGTDHKSVAAPPRIAKPLPVEENSKTLVSRAIAVAASTALLTTLAHSLGSLISADLLRLLHAQRNDPELELLGFGPSAVPNRIPIRLFTMGNPLRQLLNRFFPYLYGWVRENPDNGLEPLPRPSAGPTAIPASPLPNPADLGIDLWLNAYRSGDYVGRSLWLEEWYQRTTTGSGIYPQPIITAGGGNWLEFCIGAGAHTHYWDDTAPDIAERLNQLI